MNNWIIGTTGPDRILSYLTEKQSDGQERIICFDYFDTLVTRTVYPEFTKQLAARLLSLAAGELLSADELYETRSGLERRLCEQSAAAGGELEFYLHQLAPQYLRVLREREPEFFAGWSDDEFSLLLLDIELNVETNVQQPCPEPVDVLKSIKEQGFKTVLISDFYLPSPYFGRMLAAQGLDGLLDHVYVSADCGLAKGSGRLYGKVCENLGCAAGQLVMIGDNHHADIDMARQQGIEAIHVENPGQQHYYQGWREPGQDDDEFLEAITAAQKLPFKELSFSLWLFQLRLFDRLSGENTRHVFFFSKEGEFLKKLFDRFQMDLFGCRPITSHYLLVSRKATFLASLRPLEEEDFARLFNHYRDISCKDFLLSLNLEEVLAARICSEAGIDFTTRLADLPSREEFRRLIDSPLFQEVYERRRTEQKENFIHYLDSIGVDYKEQGLRIVDVGWKGSIQDNIFHILGQQIEVAGYYVGSLIATERKKNNRKQGLLFDDTPGLSPYFHVYNNNRSLYEMMLGASHGSADGYYTREQFEQLGEDHRKVISTSITEPASEVCVATLDLPAERALFEKDVRPLQEALFSCFAAQNRAYLKGCCTAPPAEWFARQHARMVFKPSSEEVDFFERLYHLENFGVFEFTDFQSGERLPLPTRLTNLVRVIRSKTLLESGIWPPIILRRLGVGFYRYIDGYRRYRRVFGSSQS